MDSITLTIPPGAGRERALAAMTTLSWPKLDHIPDNIRNSPEPKPVSDPVFVGDADVICDLSSPRWLHLLRDDQPAKRKRRPSATYAARLARREGVEVKRSPDGTLTMKPINDLDIAPTDDADNDNEWDRLQ